MKMYSLVIALSLVSSLTIAQRRNADPAVTALLEQKDTIALSQQLQKLKNSTREEDLRVLISYYNARQNASKRDEIQALAAKRFPNGLSALDDMIGKIYDEADGPKNEKNFDALKKRFFKNPALKGNIKFDHARYYVAASFANENPDKTISWVSKVEDSVYRTKAYSYAARELAAAKNYKAAETLIRRSLMDLERRGQTSSPEYTEYAKAAAAYLLANKKFAEGFIYAKLAYTENNKDKQLKETYLNLLVATEQYKEAFPMMEESIKTGNATPLIKERFEQAYTSAKGSSAGYQEYYTSLTQAFTEKIKQEVAAKMVNEAAFNFTLTDLNGKTVTLESLKGKVVVLDFWATWCGPCKASFPQMQLAVDQHKNDPEVQFLFTHTWETNPDPVKDAGNYIRDHKYTFDVLMDLKDKDLKTNAAAVGYGLRGIPAKFIIDKKGAIRFRSMGNSAGGEDAFLTEMNAMIELAKES